MLICMTPFQRRPHGSLRPTRALSDVLSTGQVGYVITGMKAARSARVGDTWHVHNQPVEALRGFQPALPKVFAGIYPMSAEQFNSLQEAIVRGLGSRGSIAFIDISQACAEQRWRLAGGHQAQHAVGINHTTAFLSLQDRLLLTDSSVVIQREHSAALGMGFRCGFLGLLHMDVFRQRLEQEYGAIAVITSPTGAGCCHDTGRVVFPLPCVSCVSMKC